MLLLAAIATTWIQENVIISKRDSKQKSKEWLSAF